jgi:hypothetical protein
MNNNGLRRVGVQLAALVGLVVAASAARAQSTEPAELRWKLQAGDQLTVDFTQHSTISSEVRGRSIEMINNWSMEMSWRVERVDDQGNAIIAQTLRRLTLDMTVPGTTRDERASIDTDQPADSDAAEEIRQAILPLVNSEFTVTMSPRGQILAVEIPESTMQALRNAPSSMRARRLLTPDGLREVYSLAVIELPDETIAPNETWSATRPLAMAAFDGQLTNTYTYEGPVDREGATLDRISVAGTVAIEPRPAADADGAGQPAPSGESPRTDSTDQPAAPSQSAPNGEIVRLLKITEQSSTGEILFDRSAGNLASAQLETRLVTETPYRDMVIRAVLDSNLSMSCRRE